MGNAMLPTKILIPVIILSVIGMCLQGIFIAVEHKEKYVAAAVLKGTAAMIFVIIGFIGYKNLLKCANAYNTDITQGLTKSVCFMICLGLFCGMLGDVLLALRFVFKSVKNKVFLTGTVVFFIGHILYIIALLPMSVNLWKSVLIGTAVAAIILVAVYKVIDVKLVFKFFGIFYIEAVVVMTAIAIGNRIAVDSAFRTWYAVGAVLFTVSDVVMIINSFGKNHRFFQRIMNLSLYYLGQLLIATSLFFIYN